MLKVKRVPKPPSALIKKAKKYHIKVTKKVGRKRLYKRVSVLKKQIKNAMRKMRKTRRVRKSRFGFGEPAVFNKETPGYGYNQKVNQYPGTPSQSSAYVDNVSANSARPANMELSNQYVPTYGTYKDFFGQKVPD
jgi:hypothetical protein